MATPDEIRNYRTQRFGKPRNDGAAPIHGYSREFQGTGRGSGLDEFYANQAGAAPGWDPRFRGQTGADIARDLNSRGERTGFGGRGIEPDMNMSPQMRMRLGYGRNTGDPFNRDRQGGPIPRQGRDVPVNSEGGYGPPGTRPGFTERGYDVPVNEKGGYDKAAAPGGDPFAAMPSTRKPLDEVNDPYAPPTNRAPVGPPTPMVDPENTPARFREMAADAAIGRTTKTSGAEGLTPGPGGSRPMQAADFRRSIDSKYGRGTNETRQMGQGPATTTDLMGRPALLKDYMQDRQEIQNTKMKPFPKGGEEEETPEAEDTEGEES